MCIRDRFCTDESSQADAPVNGFQVAGQGSVITAVHKKVLTLVTVSYTHLERDKDVFLADGLFPGSAVFLSEERQTAHKALKQ